jgi:hypothetical protein
VTCMPRGAEPSLQALGADGVRRCGGAGQFSDNQDLQAQISTTFDRMDEDGSGGLDFDEFRERLVPPVRPVRNTTRVECSTSRKAYVTSHECTGLDFDECRGREQCNLHAAPCPQGAFDVSNAGSCDESPRDGGRIKDLRRTINPKP